MFAFCFYISLSCTTFDVFVATFYVAAAARAFCMQRYVVSGVACTTTSQFICVCTCVVSYKLQSNTSLLHSITIQQTNRAVTKIMLSFPKTVLRLFSKPKTRPSGNIHSRPMIQQRWTRARRKTSRCVWCAWHLAPGIKRESWFMFCSFLECLSFFCTASIQLLSDEPHSMANI